MALVALVGLVQLAAVPIYVDAVTNASFHRILADAPLEDSSIVVELGAPPDLYDEADRVVSGGIGDVAALSRATVTRRISSPSFELPDQTPDAKIGITVFTHLFEIERHATLVEGAWPSPPDAASVPSVLEEKRAAALGLSIGDLVDLSARSDLAEVTVEIVGLYEIVDPTDPFWSGDALLIDGVVDGQSFRTVGPFVVAPESMRSGQLGRLSATWQIDADLDSLGVEDADRLQSSVANLGDQLNVRLAASSSGVPFAISGLEVTTRLPALLAETSRSLTVTRSAVTAVVVQLALLAALALAITARLVLTIRRPERELLNARGATRRQTLAVSLFETLFIVAPAALVAPWIAAWLLDISSCFGPLGSIKLDIRPVVSREAYLTVVVSGLAMVMIFAWPSIRRSPIGTTSAIRHVRQRRHSITQRAGIDVALVVLTGVAFWQLRVLGPQKTASIGDRFSVDPILVVVPALALLTAAVATLRLVPVMAKLSERQAASRRSVIAALAAWQIARRPASQAQPAFLLVMAISIGFFAASYSATWTHSQLDRANHQVGADVRLIPNRRTNDSLTNLHLASAHGRLDGVAATMAMARRPAPLPGSERPGWFLLLNSERASEVVNIRDGAQEFRDLMTQLADARPTVPSIALPDETSRLELRFKVAEEPVEDVDGEVLEPAFKAKVRLVLQDGDEMLHGVDIGSIASTDLDQTLSIDLTARFADAELAKPVHPLSLVEIQFQTSAPAPPARSVVVELVTLNASGLSDPSFVTVDVVAADWQVGSSVLAGLLTRQSIAVDSGQGDSGLRTMIDTGSSQSNALVFFSVRPGRTSITEAIPVVVSRDWFLSTDAQIGDVIQFPDLARVGHRGQIVGVMETFPTIDPTDSDFMLIDLPTVQTIDHANGSTIFSIDEAWIDLADDADEGDLIRRLAAPPYESFRVDGSQTRNRSLSTDPAALAAIGAFFIGFVAAAIFAVIVFALSVAVSARERAGEFTLLRALGLSPGQFQRWMALEQGAMLFVSLVVGTLIGWLLSVSILPLIALDQEGRTVVPTIDVIHPWASIALVELMSVVAMVLLIVVSSRRKRDESVAAGIRMTDN